MKTQDCDHHWIEDSQETAYSNCYDVTPVSIYICTKCGVGKEIVEGSNLLWYEHILINLIMPILMIIFVIIMPIIIVIYLIWEIFLPKWKVES